MLVKHIQRLGPLDHMSVAGSSAELTGYIQVLSSDRWVVSTHERPLPVVFIQ